MEAGAASSEAGRPQYDAGPLDSDFEDPFTPDCIVMLYDWPVDSAEEARAMHGLSLAKEHWKCVKARKEDVAIVRCSHMPRGSAVAGDLQVVRKVTVCEPAPTWEGKQFYVPEVFIVALDVTWEEMVAFLRFRFFTIDGIPKPAPLACWCSWPAERVFVSGRKVALHPDDLRELTSPMKNQSGLFAARYSRESGQKRVAPGTVLDLTKRRLEYNKPGPGSAGAGGAEVTDGVQGNPKFDITRKDPVTAVETIKSNHWNISKLHSVCCLATEKTQKEKEEALRESADIEKTAIKVIRVKYIVQKHLAVNSR